MPRLSITSGPNRASSQGAALLIMLLIIVMGFSASLISSLAGQNVEATRQRKTSEALAQAKQALIAWSVLQGDLGTGTNVRPGTLPCPDTNFFGSSSSGNAAGSCSAGGETSIGRLPWKTLGIEMLRDANGEPLWYVLSDAFRGPTMNNDAVNSDAKGTLQLYAPNGTSLLTPSGEELAAVIFSSGAPLFSQDRIAVPDGTESYLDTGGGRSNRSASGPFIQGPVNNAAGDTVVNDLLIGISAKELIAALEKRSLREAENALGSFALAHGGKYPNPASASCNALISNINTPGVCASDATTCIGRVPEDVLAVAPQWFLRNGWGRSIIYGVNKSNVQSDVGTNCSSSLKVGGALREYVLIAPGSAAAGQTRPSTALANYLEDPENVDAWSGDPDFALPGAGSNDQMRSKP